MFTLMIPCCSQWAKQTNSGFHHDAGNLDGGGSKPFGTVVVSIPLVSFFSRTFLLRSFE